MCIFVLIAYICTHICGRADMESALISFKYTDIIFFAVKRKNWWCSTCCVRTRCWTSTDWIGLNADRIVSCWCNLFFRKKMLFRFSPSLVRSLFFAVFFLLLLLPLSLCSHLFSPMLSFMASNSTYVPMCVHVLFICIRLIHNIIPLCVFLYSYT